MPFDKMHVGPCPSDEDCAQVGENDYPTRARSECQRFIQLIRDRVGKEPHGATLRIVSESHELGTYLEVACVYDVDNEEATDYAFRVDREAPTRW